MTDRLYQLQRAEVLAWCVKEEAQTRYTEASETYTEICRQVTLERVRLHGASQAYPVGNTKAHDQWRTMRRWLIARQGRG